MGAACVKGAQFTGGSLQGEVGNPRVTWLGALLKYLPCIRRRGHWLVCALVVLLVPVLHLWASLQCWSNSHGDWLTRQRTAQQVPDPRLMVVDIESARLQVLVGEAGNWPWPRSRHSE